MTTNKPNVQRYGDMGAEQICPVNNMYGSDDGNYVLYEDYEALQAECDKLRKHLQNLIDQTTPLEPEPRNPMWSRRIQLDEVLAERDQLRAECEKLKAALAESRANDRQAMTYLAAVREIVRGDDFPDMIQRVRQLNIGARQHHNGGYQPVGSSNYNAKPPTKR